MTAKENGITKTALIVVGEVLGDIVSGSRTLIRLGLSPHRSERLLAPVLERFYSMYENCDIQIIEQPTYILRQMIDEGEIWIRIFEDGEDIIFQVEDNGIGMTEEQCREILRKEPGDRTGIGIKNVNDRIKIYFGSNYGLNITSELDEGTCVTIRMPKVREEEYEKK